MTDKTLKSRLLGAAVMSVLLVSGCSSVPDAINPVEWYKSTVDLFDDEEGAAQAEGLPADTEGRQQAEAKAREFPQVSSVPEASSAPDTDAVRQGLIADREQRRYASAPIARQDEDSAGTVTASAGLQPPPPAMPAVPVTPAPMKTAQSAPAMAPSGATQVASAPLAPTTVAETFRARLAEKFKPTAGSDQVAPVAMPEPPKPVAPANSLMPSVGDPLATVVISSDGVQSQGSQVDQGEAVYVAGTSATGVTAGAGMSSTAAPKRPQPRLSGGTVKLATILFGNGNAALTANDMKILRQVTRIVKDRGGRLRIVGHASSRTRNMDLVRHKMVNFQVSANRADAVAKALVDIGVAPELISVVARSDAEPLYYEVMPSGEAGNRRTEIFLDS